MSLSPNRSPREGWPIKLVVIHGDAGKTDAGTIAWIMDPKSRVSYHYLVGRSGQVTMLVPEAEKAWHAGKSAWIGCTHKGSVNHMSVGVAYANDGQAPYPEKQVVAGARLVAEICKRHHIERSEVRSHAEVSPGRKTDPWAHFPWAVFWEEWTNERIRLG